MKNKSVDKKKLKIYLLFLVATLYFMIIVVPVYSDPPTPQNVYGKVLHNNSQGVANGYPVLINNTNITQMFYTQVFAPPIPSLAGAYSLTINGSSGDIIMIRSYNSTHYGQATKVISAGSTELNVTLNLTRYSETNVTIISPDNNSLFNSSVRFNVSVNVSVLGRNGANCNITLFVTNESIVSFPPGTNYTNPLGSLTMGTYVTTYFELLSLKKGSVNITATGQCSTDGLNFEGLNIDMIENITIQDNNPPVIRVIAPDNNTINKTSNEILFLYNVSDSSNIDNCTLYIDDIFNESNDAIIKDTTLNFTKNLSSGYYNWSIVCFDEYLNFDTTGTYYLNVSVYYPLITAFDIFPSIVLNAGGVKDVQCNITVEDANGPSEIDTVNATFYSYTVDHASTDNNNTHYTNSSCENTGSSGNSSNFTCTYSLLYYALNGSWYCNATAYNIDGLYDNNKTNTSIETLYALNTSVDVVDYGDVEAGAYSNDEIVIITNFGNMPINLSVLGYGGNDPVLGDGYAMLCDSGDNISIDDERYSLQGGQSFLVKTPLTSINKDMNFTLQKQTIPAALQDNTTYWQLYVTAQNLGLCSGTIKFTATNT